MLASAAATPPCAATVCERVGNTLLMQAVFKPCWARPKVARRPAPPAPTTTMSNSCSWILYPVMSSVPKRDADDSKHPGDRGHGEDEAIQDLERDAPAGMDVVLDHRLHAQRRVPAHGDNEGDDQHRVERMMRDRAMHGVIAALRAADDQPEEIQTEENQR